MIVLRSKALALATVAIMFGGIALSSAFNLWLTTSSKEPAKIKSGDFAGLPNPSDIRGSYTWADIAKTFSLPEKLLLEAFGATTGSEKVNSLEARFTGKLPEGLEIGTDSVRLFTALYTGLPHLPESDTVLPQKAIELLRSEGKGDSALIEAAAARAIATETVFGTTPLITATPTVSALATANTAAQSPAAATAKPSAPEATTKLAPIQETAAIAPKTAQGTPDPAKTEHSVVVGAITGKTSFYDLKAWGYDMKKVEEALGGLGPSNQSVKDFCAAKSLPFSEAKTKLEGIAPR